MRKPIHTHTIAPSDIAISPKPIRWLTVEGKHIPVLPHTVGSPSATFQPQPIQSIKTLLEPIDPNARRIDIGRTVEQTINPQLAWYSYAAGTYRQKVPEMAIREAFQNSRDAVLSNPTSSGQITFSIRADEGIASFADTGIGMDVWTLVDKFLALHESGKRDNTRTTGGTVGGFGVAKAVITGLANPDDGESWSIRTRNLALDSSEIGHVTGVRDDATGVGTEITWKISPEKLIELSGAGENWYNENCNGPVKYLAYSDFPKKLHVTYSAGGVQPDYDIAPLHLPGRPIESRSFANPDGEPTKVAIRQITSREFSRINDDRSAKGLLKLARTGGSAVIRLNGLTQLFDYVGEINGTMIVDIDTGLSPFSDNYPFDPHRSKVTDERINNMIREAANKMVVARKTSASGDEDKAHKTLNGSTFEIDDWGRPVRQVGDIATLYSMVAEKGSKKLAGYALKCPKAERLGEGSLSSSYGDAARNWLRVPHYAGNNVNDYSDMARAAANYQRNDSPPEYYLHTLAENTLSEESWTPPDYTFHGPRTLTPDQIANFTMFKYMVSAVASRISGQAVEACVHMIGPSKNQDRIAELKTTSNGRSVGVVGGLMTQNASPYYPDSEQFFTFMQAETIHELSHIFCNDHNTNFVCTMGDILRKCGNIWKPLRQDVDEMWNAYYGPRRNQTPEQAEASRESRKQRRDDLYQQRHQVQHTIDRVYSNGNGPTAEVKGGKIVFG